jgi:ABC-2 type transport system ATP-binding protein
MHKRIGYLSGEMVFDDDLTGEQYLFFLNELFGAKYTDKINELAGLLKIDLRKKIGNYSRGNKQKIGLIAALMHTPDLLILDEPTNGFDPLVQEIFATLIREYNKNGGTVFMSSHILSEVQELCDRVSFISEGSIVGTTSINELLETASKKIRVLTTQKDHGKLKSEYHNLEGLALTKELPNSLIFSYKGDVTKLLNFFSKQSLIDINIQEPDLEDVFVKYYKKVPGEELS